VEAGSYLSRFAELIRSILYNSREDFITLDNEIKTLKNYFELQQLRYNHKFDFEIDVDPELFPEEISIPPMIAQPFIENAVEHGIKYIEEKGHITVSFTLLDDSLMLTVEDNGIGIKAAKNLKNEKASEHKSLATIITRERIDILNKGKRKKLYSMQVQDTKDVNGNIDGTRVKLIIPFKQT
jgi:LytS/YehU family sensor histidine kinase